MPSGGSYTFVNITSETINLPRHDQTGMRRVRPGEGFNGPAYYERFVAKGLLARTSAETATVQIVINELDLIPRSGIYAGTTNGSYYELPPWRFQRKATSVSPYYGSETESCLGKPKARISFDLNAKPDDTMMVTYFFYTSSINPSVPTFEISRPEVLSTNWQYPTWAPLPNDFYTLSPQQQYEALISQVG